MLLVLIAKWSLVFLHRWTRVPINWRRNYLHFSLCRCLFGWKDQAIFDSPTPPCTRRLRKRDLHLSECESNEKRWEHWESNEISLSKWVAELLVVSKMLVVRWKDTVHPATPASVCASVSHKAHVPTVGETWHAKCGWCARSLWYNITIRIHKACLWTCRL